MQDNYSSDLIGQRQERLAKVNALREMGINPYPATSNKSHNIGDVTNDFDSFNTKTVTLAGRLMSKREHGQLVFADIHDFSAKIQAVFRSDTLHPLDKDSQLLGFEELSLIDTGDFVEITGEVMRTNRGEISIMVKELRLLTKSIRPLPDLHQGLTDKELRYRRRYLDLVVNPEVRERFARKAKFWKVNREFLQSRGFIEVETPVLEHKTGGADARPFITHHNDLDKDFYLRISTELYQKRLIGGGFDKIYTLGPNFRNEGTSDEHLQEYYQLEWYWAYANYEDNMQMLEEMFKTIALEVYGKTKFTTRGHTFDLADKWQRIDYPIVIKERFGVDIFTDSEEKMLKIIEEQGVKLTGEINRNRLIDNLWKIIRKSVSGPAFLINEPKFMSPLAKSKSDNAALTERFHVLIAGSELGNGYSEINDPVDQLERFMDQEKLRVGGDDEAQMLDIDFVEMLEYGMPPVSGYGHSERVFWFLEDVTAREGTLFPLLRDEVDEVTKEIYKGVLRIDEPASLLQNTSLVTGLDFSKLTKLNFVAISTEVKKRFPGLKTGYIVVEGLKIEKSNQQTSLLMKSAVKIVKSTYSSKQEIKSSKSIAGFRDVYKQTGADPDSKLNSAEALISRIVSDKGLYNVNTLVDTYNATSAELGLPMAAYDLDKVNGTIELRFASEGEKIFLIGHSEPVIAGGGEMVYADGQGIICLNFNYRDADRTKITESTGKAIVFVDGHSDIPDEDILNALDILASRIEKNCGGKVIGYNLVSRGTESDQNSRTVTFAEAQDLVDQSVTDPYQRMHARMISLLMREYARIIAEKYPESADTEKFDPELWAICGLIHDWDYQFDPEGHPENNVDKLRAKGYPEEIIQAILGHKPTLGVSRTSKMAQALLAIDELAGLLFAYNKMKGGYQDMDVKGVLKKLKDKGFASKVNREDILLGVNELGITLEEHIANILDILKREGAAFTQA